MHMKAKTKRFIALMLSLSLIMTCFSVTVVAESTEEQPNENEAQNAVTVIMDEPSSEYSEAEDDIPEPENVPKEAEGIPVDTDEVPEDNEQADATPLLEETDLPAEEAEESESPEIPEDEPLPPVEEEPETVKDPIRAGLDENGYVYMESSRHVDVFTSEALKSDSRFYATDSHAIWLVTSCSDNNIIRVYFLDADGNTVNGYTSAHDMISKPISEDRISEMTENMTCAKVSTPVGMKYLFLVSNTMPQVEAEADNVAEAADPEVENTPIPEDVIPETVPAKEAPIEEVPTEIQVEETPVEELPVETDPAEEIVAESPSEEITAEEISVEVISEAESMPDAALLEENNAEEMPSEVVPNETPLEEVPDVEMSEEELPVEAILPEDTAVEEPTAEEEPEEIPLEEEPADDIPEDETPVEVIPTEDTTVEEIPVEAVPDEMPSEEDPVEEIPVDESPIDVVEPEDTTAEEMPEEEIPEEVIPEETVPAHQTGDYVSVTTSTRVFTRIDPNAVNQAFTNYLDGCFIKDAIVQIEAIEQDANGNDWYKVTYLYGNTLRDGSIKWTESNSVYVLASETADTEETACTVTDYAFTKEQLQQKNKRKLMSFSATGMNGFSLKSINVSLGSFEAFQKNLRGSSGRDSEYPQLAKSTAHGTVYATPHYLEGYTVFCLEHPLNGPGEGSGSSQAPTGPYVLVDMDTFVNDPSGGGVNGVQYKESTMHAIAWVLRHTYPFMALDRSDEHNLQWSRVAGQFAIREVIKQLEGAKYVRDYWDLSNFYNYSDGAPAVYLTYAKWLAENGIKRAGITGKVTTSNLSVTASGTSFIGSVTLTTDADLIRIPKSVGTLTGNSGGADSNYYYAKSGDTVKLTSTNKKFSLSMESVSSDSEEANFLVGIPSVTIQKVLVPTYGKPYPLQSANVTFELKLGEIQVTKKSSDGILLKNTVFELLNSSGTVIRTATTNANGTALFDSLEPGSYKVREKTAPQGYSISTTSTQNVSVVAGSTTPVTFTNNRISGKIRIVKTDKITSKPLSGATFTVTRISGPESDNASNIGKVVATITTNASGIAETGTLPWGEYKVVETGVPDGYLDPGYSVNVWIK